MRKIIEGAILVLFVIGIGYIIYTTVLQPKFNRSLLKKGALESKGFVYEVGGNDLNCWLNYWFRGVDGKTYLGVIQCTDENEGVHEGDSINVLYLKEDPKINYRKEDLGH